MVTLLLSLSDALRCRFVISPIGEVVQLARAIAVPGSFMEGRLRHGCAGTSSRGGGSSGRTIFARCSR